MGRYVLARLLATIPTILIIALLVVILVRVIPGSAVDLIMKEDAFASDATREQIEAELGLDQSIPETYVRYVLGFVTGDLGESLWSKQPVTDMVARPLVISLELMALAMVMVVLVGVPLGVISGIKRATPLDYLLRAVSILGLSIPNFAVATAIMVLPALWWGWSPPLIYTPFAADPIAHVMQFLAPAAVLALALSATVMRFTRTLVLEVSQLDYVRTARAKGLDNRVVILNHILRNALIPVLTVIGLQVTVLISGTVIIENIFPIPGLGRLIYDAVAARDYPVIQGVAVLVGVMVVLLNLAIDLAYRLVDPRVSFT